MSTAPRSRRKPKLSRTPAVLVPGVLWGATCILIVVAALLTVAGFLLKTTWLPAVAWLLLAIAALSLLTMAVYTLPRNEAYDWSADLTVFPAVIRWPLQAGTWAGNGAVLLVFLWLALTSVGGSPEVGARFAMSMVAVVGAIVTLIASVFVPATLMYALVILWGAVVVVALLRGIYGIVAALVR